jgi:hypothetical protein
MLLLLSNALANVTQVEFGLVHVLVGIIDGLTNVAAQLGSNDSLQS